MKRTRSQANFGNLGQPVAARTRGDTVQRTMLAGSVLSVLALSCSSNTSDGTLKKASQSQNALEPTSSEPRSQPTTLGLKAAAGMPFSAGAARAAPSKPATTNQLIVKFRTEGAHALTECFERWTREGRSFRDATADKSDSLDRLSAHAGVRRAHALMPGRAELSTAVAKQVFRDRLTAAKSRFPSRAARTRNDTPGTRINEQGNFTNVYVVDLAAGADLDSAARAFANDTHVLYAQPNYPVVAYYTPNDPYYKSANSWGQGYDDLWGLKKINAATAWDTTQGDGVIVAVVDTGLDLSHEDIKDNVWSNSDEIAGNGLDDDKNGFKDDTRGWDFVNNDADPTDDHGHGTHVSGTIAAIGNNGVGVIGVAPHARIMPVKGLDSSGNGDWAKLAQAIAYAAANGADVISGSLGCKVRCPNNPIAADAVTAAHNQGAVVVFAAGNSNDDVAYYSPQNDPNVIVVGASAPDDTRAFFSNYGLVDVLAPGGAPDVAPPSYEPARNILSLRAAGCGADMCPSGLVVGSSYSRQAGTSMATPHVSGLAALVLAKNPSYSPEEVRQVLRRSSADVGVAGLDADSGYGRIDAAKALSQPRPLSALIAGPLTEISGTAPATIVGSALGSGFASYKVEYGSGTAPATFTTIASSASPVTNGTLASWNPVPDGQYTLRLTATTTDGRTYEDRQLVTVNNVKITEPAPNVEVTPARTGDVISIKGTVSPASFTGYSLSIASSNGTQLTNPSVTLTNGGKQPVVNGTIATWNTAGLAADEYTVTLTITMSSGGPTVKTFRYTVDPTLHPGWPKSLGFNMDEMYSHWLFRDHLTLADVNGDGGLDMLIAYANIVTIYDHTGATLPGWPQRTDTLGVQSSAQISPVVGDITGDGVSEIISGDNYGNLFVWSPTGTALPGWPRNVGGDLNALAVADIDGNGVQEIIAADWWGQVKVLRSDGTSLPGWPVSIAPGETLSALAVGDVNHDGKLEIAVAVEQDYYGVKQAPNVWLLSSTGTVMQGWPKAISVGLGGFPVLGDLDGDGDLEVVVGADDGTVYAFHHTGTNVTGWPKTTTATAANGPSLADLTGDGKLDVVIGTFPTDTNYTLSDYMFAWRNDGTALPGWPVLFNRPLVYGTANGYGAPMLGDLDNDGKIDVVAEGDVSLSPRVTIGGYRNDGSILPGFPKLAASIGSAASNMPAVGDLDRDGKLELTWMDLEENIYVWDLDTPVSAKVPWPMFGHDARHTNNGGSLACSSESDAAFCSRLAKNCGTVTGTDNCGKSRTVTSCGTCTTPQTCGGSGSPNVCGGTSGSGGASSVGGSSSIGGNTGSGGAPASGGRSSTGGTRSSGGASSSGGRSSTGGTRSSGGAPAAGGASSTANPCAGLCSSPLVFTGPNYQSGNLGTNAVCRETKASLNGGNCSNMQSRVLSVNGITMNCTGWALPAKRNGGYCIQVTAGTPDWASFATW